MALQKQCRMRKIYVQDGERYAIGKARDMEKEREKERGKEREKERQREKEIHLIRNLN